MTTASAGPGLRYVRTFEQIGADDVASVGGKNASLGEMYRELRPRGIPVPDGFAVTANAYRDILTASRAWDALHEQLDAIDPREMEDFARRARRAHEIVLNAPLPQELQEEILRSYRMLQAEYGQDVSLAVRSSATAEDLPTASFAGQHESFLNVRGEDQLIAAYRRCIASLFLERAIHYRIDKGFDHFKIALSVGVMKMVRSDLSAAGVAFTLDTESGFRDVVFINGSYGLAENVVQGSVDPDEFYIHKPTYEHGYRAVIRRRIGSKSVKLIFAQTGTVNVNTPPQDQRRACISDEDALTIAGYAMEIERHYSDLARHPVPMDVEWAKDGIDGRIYAVQARPETVASQKPAQLSVFENYRLTAPAPKAIVTGRSVGSRIASGKARVVKNVSELAQVQPGDVLIAATTSPDWEPAMKIASAIVTDRGGRTCHAAIVARELGIPAVVGAKNATWLLESGSVITVDCAQGEAGYVYADRVPFEVQRIEVGALAQAPVKLMLTLGMPDNAFALSALPNDGVGLARMEFIISDDIKVHPMALAHPERVTDPAARAHIVELTGGYGSSREYFIRKLSEGAATIAAAFYPKPVIVRMSDFKTNEYAALLGGAVFEPAEANPMLGFRGASRYAHPAYIDGFALECAAMRRVRDDMGFSNVVLMIPFCRRVAEARLVLQTMARFGLDRGRNGLQIYMMCEIPNNVLQIDAFAGLFDGFSIGSNDLAQLVLGVDRDSELVAFDFDERDEGVVEMLRLTIEGAKRNGRHVGICGQAPSDYPELARKLVAFGIESLSLNPDSLLKTRSELF
ncbi:MAG TPA: phosphoenolpyruvate synthase [Candidatus Baltobacteraceae bacterium]|nr:phosphoenolpyruvate synthase [Candidatus Baltobacteraceae bacterium]